MGGGQWSTLLFGRIMRQMQDRYIRIIISVLLIFTAAREICAQQLDSTVRNALDARLSEYFAAIEREGADVQKEECDFLIDTCKDSLMRQHVALSIYDHYVSSKVMGAEAVAIHVFDNWFATGKVKMRNDSEMMAARVFTEFNRMSLIGEDAPELTLFDFAGKPVDIFGDDRSGRYSILYFYDSSCATCKLQTILLRNLLQDEDFPVDMYAVYAAGNKSDWKAYVDDQLTINAENVNVFHLWDPEISSDFQRKYGVVMTPRLFLIGPDGRIIGRSLDAQALSQMFHMIFDEVELEYGSDESVALYDGLFAGSVPSQNDVETVSDYIMSSTLEKGDTVMFRQMTGDLLYYLTLQRGEAFKEGLDGLIKGKILSMPSVWKSEDDSLKVVGMAEMYHDLLSKSTPGKTVPDMKLPGVLLSKGKEKAGEFKLRKLRGKDNYIMFVTDGCHVCAAEKAEARVMVAEDRKVRILMVNVDDVLSSDPALASRMFDSFDLSVLPFIMQTDRKGHIVRRYMSLAD